MNTTKRKIVLAFAYLVAFTSIAKAQPGTLEMTLPGNAGTLKGPSIAPVAVNMWQDNLNLTAGTVFNPASPALTMTMSLQNQQYNNSYGAGQPGAISTGIVFGGGNTASSGGTIQQSDNTYIYSVLGQAITTQPPLNGMFMSSPSATPLNHATANYQLGGRGVGLDIEGTQGGHDITPAGADDVNTGVALFTNVEPLFDAGADKAGRYYYGDLVITFSRPVINPVVHVGGLGGSYAYLPTTPGATPLIAYFSTELELQNTSANSTFTSMSGNEYFTVSGNKILNSSATPNGGSTFSAASTVLGFNTYGAASGSVRVGGTYTQLIYKVYVRGSANSNFNFSAIPALGGTVTRRPMNGDLFYMAVSLDRPNQQISGNVFNDRDGLNDAGGGDINKSAGVANPTTNIGGTLYANLLNAAGLVVASTSVNNEGGYLFDNVPLGVYTVQLTNASSLGTYVTPAVAPATTLTADGSWVNTGEFNGKTAGSDGTVNGKSAAVTVAAVTPIITDVNFGVERVPDSKSFSTFIGRPGLNIVLHLNDTLPILTGSDPEDMPTEAILTGKKLQITALPTNSTLQYNGVNVSVGQIITNYDPTKLTILFNVATSVPQTDFFYAYIDAAGKPDPTPARYLLLWPPGGPLAVTLESFTATGADCGARIDWKTSNELNLASYVVEVSKGDQSHFVTASAVTPRGSVTTEAYQATYSMQTNVIYYYRLKMVNLDGTVSYSPIRVLSCGGKTMIVIAPNPVRDQFTISGMNNGKNTVVIYSTEGKMMAQQVISGNSGTMNISRFTAGTYVVKVIAADGTDFSAKIIKK